MYARLAALAAALTLTVPPLAVAQDSARFDELGASFPEVKPLLQRYCHECHAGDTLEAEIDLAAFDALADVRKQPQVWIKVREMLASRQMPPKDSPQPTDAERDKLQAWVRSYLAKEAETNAGDPGPVVLRRLSNAEYTYSLRDLTGVDALDPAREFPVDGAAGEGFTNVGVALGMSPSLVEKYLDAGKEVANRLVLLPDGIRFANHTTRRDQTDAIAARIQAFYRQFTSDGGGQAVNLQGIKFDTNQGGVLPLLPYLTATLAERDAMASGDKSPVDVARERQLNAKYLTLLWSALTAKIEKPSLLLDRTRASWWAAKPEDAERLASEITAARTPLWKFNPVGHIGTDGRPRVWMEGVDPLTSKRDFRLELPEASQDDVSIVLASGDAGDGRDHDYVIWDNPRLVSDSGPVILLRDLDSLRQRLDQLQREALAKTAAYLAAADEFEPGQDESRQVAELAERRQLDIDALRAWLDYLAISETGEVEITGHFVKTHVNPTYDFVRGWGLPDTPIVLANRSDNDVRIPGISRGHSVVAHPSPTMFIAIGWRAPIAGLVKVEASLNDAHPECGNGQEWFVQHRTVRKVGTLGHGSFNTAGSDKMEPRTIAVGKGDVVSFILGPREGSHACDLTEMHFTISEVDGEQRTWDLAKDVSSDLDAANPHPDSHGNATTWHFYQGRVDSIDSEASTFVSVPPESILGQWQREEDEKRRAELAAEVQAFALGKPPEDEASPSGVLHQQLATLAAGKLDVASLIEDLKPDQRFGKHPLGHEADSADLVVHAPTVVEFTLPGRLASGRTLVATARLDDEDGIEGSAKAEVSLQPLEPKSLGGPILVNEGTASRSRIEQAFQEFRDLFPPNLCYARIVPVDEVVTVTLFYRQDDALQRLMLDDEQSAQLDRLWDELFYVAREPLRYEVAFEQIREFATQDRPDLVKVWAPLVDGVTRRAKAFRQRLLETESIHVDALLEFTERAWRRPLTSSESHRLRALYHQLRADEIPHEEAVKLTLARVLSSPAFLYRRETPGLKADAIAVSPNELATRLSYFLWSSTPDDELRRAATAGELKDDARLLVQTRRMLVDQRTRRLAIHFACQWLHVRDFDQNDDKNEKLYPEFATLRSDMYEETVRFFEDMFRNDGSILDLYDADHTFLNESLATHYGIEGVDGSEWRRVDGVRSRGRGGILGQATVLASQSGASRTSPILRGNWIFETLLGERLPRPPADVPQLPEAVPSGLTARQLIEKHSSVPECAKCHALIDPYGFALEQFDAIGRTRSQAVDTKTKLVDGTDINGLEGLRSYLVEQRRDDLVRQFCRKLLGYALGREVQLSDEPLLAELQAKLADSGYRFHVAVEAIVTSDQFRKIRGTGSATE